MDIRALTDSIAQSLQPASATRAMLPRQLEQLADATKRMKAAGVDAASLLTHITLVQVRIFAPGVSASLSDRERELALEALRDALTPDRRISEAHAIIVDHLSRILVPLFAVVCQTALPEPTRQLAMECWRRLVTVIAAVHVPPTHPPPARGPSSNVQRIMALRDYVTAYLPADYLALASCALLDNAELADSHSLRRLALDTLRDALQTDGILCDALRPIFPGVSSAMARIALAQPPRAAGSSGGLAEGMAEVTITEPRKHTAAVRAQALRVLSSAIRALYRGDASTQTLSESASADDWAQRARQGVDSILQQTDSDENSDLLQPAVDDADPEDEYHQRLLQMLWRLAGLRHTEHAAISQALLDLFSAVVLDCAALQDTRCVSVSIQACLAIGSRQAPQEHAEFMRRLAELCCIPSLVHRQVVGLLESALPLFDQYIVGGSEQQRADVLRLVAGYFCAMGRDEARALVSPWWAARGLRLFLDSLAVSLPGTSLLISDVSDSSNQPRTPVTLVLDAYRTTELAGALEQFIVQTASVITPPVLCSQLLALLNSQGARQFQPSVLWLLTRVAPMATGTQLAAVYQPAFQYCVDYFGSSSRRDAADSPDMDSASMDVSKTGGTAVDKDHVLRSCAVLNAISAIVPTVGPAVAYYMDMLLFPLLQISSSEASPLLRDQAQRSLMVLAQTAGSLSVADMLKENVDYIVEGCSQQIRSVELHPHVFQILTGAVQLVGQDILVFMDDVVEDSLDVCEDLVDDEVVTTSALQFLEVVTRTVAAGHTQSQALVKGTGSEPLAVGVSDPDPIGSILADLDSWDEQEQMSKLVNFDLSELEDSESRPNDAFAANKETAVVANPDKRHDAPGNPLAIKTSLVVQNFLSVESGSQQLLALKIVQNALHALADTRDLLPLINEVWPVLVHRLDKGRDLFYVTLAACDVIEVVCQVGETWMRKRVHDDLWLHFDRILAEATPGSVSQRSTEREIVLRILRTMKTVVKHVPLDDPTAWRVCCLSLRFLEHEPLTLHVVELLRAMVPVYADKIWLILAKIGRIADVNPASIPNLGIPADIKAPSDICQVIGLM